METPNFGSNLDPNALKDQAVAAAKAKATSLFSFDTIIGFIKTQGPMLALGYLAGKFLPWWATAPLFVAIGAVMGKSPKASFAHGTTSGTLLWSTLAAVYSNMNGGQMANMLGAVLGQGKMDVTAPHLIMVTGLMGGLLAGTGAWAGSFLRSWINDLMGKTEQVAG
jgi:hypothetical protein